MTAPADPVAVLLDRACRGVALQPAEGAALRAAVTALQQQAASADGAHRDRDAAVLRAARYRGAWRSAQRRARLIPDGGHDVYDGTRWRPALLAYCIVRARFAKAEQRAAEAEAQAGRLHTAWRSARRRAGAQAAIVNAHRAEVTAPRTGSHPLAAAEEPPADVRPPHWTDPLHPRIAVPLAGTTLPTEPGSAIDCPACRRRADIPHPWPCPGHPDGRLTPDEIAALLHAHQLHPGWEYATTTGPRKAWETADVPPYGDDGEPDHSWEPNLPAGSSRGWERFDYHEEAYWRRPSRPDNATAPGQN